MGDFISNQPVPTVKGPRNYVQLSDGSEDLTFNSDVYVTNNNVINGHIGGSGTAPQMTYFTASDTIASTPAASANVSSGQVEFSQTNGFRRLSSTYANSWEDGHMGDANQIVFTPSDFVVGSINTRSLQAQSSQPDPGDRVSRWYGVTSGDGVICAQKVVPKGFVIGGSSYVTVFTPAASQTGTTIYVSGQAVDISSTAILDLLLSSTTFSTNLPTLLNGGGNVTGDGKNIVTLYWAAGGALTTANSPSGAVITMQRV